MFPEQSAKRRKAAVMLVLATFFWGISFPAMKALGMIQQQLVPEAGSWFVTANVVAVRFAVAAVLLLFWCGRTLRHLTWLEAWQGAGLGLFAGLGMLFQMDGLAYTTASTSAFLTQSYCLILPLIVTVRDRKRPSSMILVCSVLVAAGVAILAKVDWRTFRLGRGEWETLVGSAVFTAQILWLERPVFSRNRVSHFSLVMFVGMALVSLPVGLATMPNRHAWIAVYQSATVLGLVALLIVFCTLIAFVMMNYWQPHLPAAEAGVIYTAEPVFASLFALFLPAAFSSLAGIAYPNERITWNLLLGGGLITAANLLIQMRGSQGLLSNDLLVRPAPEDQTQADPKETPVGGVQS